MLFRSYVIAHGHYSPGGGFQGGVILAAGLILISLAFSLENQLNRFSELAGIMLSNIGVLIYSGLGLLCLLLGKNFLEYGGLARLFPIKEYEAHYHSMLIVEIGVAFTVMSVLFLIFASLSTQGRLKEGL